MKMCCPTTQNSLRWCFRSSSRRALESSHKRILTAAPIKDTRKNQDSLVCALCFVLPCVIPSYCVFGLVIELGIICERPHRHAAIWLYMREELLQPMPSSEHAYFQRHAPSRTSPRLCLRVMVGNLPSQNQWRSVVSKVGTRYCTIIIESWRIVDTYNYTYISKIWCNMHYLVYGKKKTLVIL